MEKIDFIDYFYYDETSPSCLRWREDRTNTKHHKNVVKYAGDVAGFIGTDGYWYNSVQRHKSPTHKIVWEMFREKILGDELIDHEDGNCLNNNISNLRAIKKGMNSRNAKMNSRNSSGVTGVTFRVSTSGTTYARASWKQMNGVAKTKHFNVSKLGIMVAFRDAVIHRQKMIEELNSQGAGYTERHGKGS